MDADRSPSPLSSHQTVRLEAGSHTGPEDGVCVMELASMLAGEPFSDRPQCVCPIIGTVLRAYNDLASPAHRQDLYGCAALVVDTRAGEDIEWARAARCLAWIEERRASRPRWRRLLMRRRPDPGKDPRSTYLPRLVPWLKRADDQRHEQIVELVEDLVAIRSGGGGSFRPPAPLVPLAPSCSR